jgi:hypothetical protein
MQDLLAIGLIRLGPDGELSEANELARRLLAQGDGLWLAEGGGGLRGTAPESGHALPPLPPTQQGRRQQHHRSAAATADPLQEA